MTGLAAALFSLIAADEVGLRIVAGFRRRLGVDAGAPHVRELLPMEALGVSSDRSNVEPRSRGSGPIARPLGAGRRTGLPAYKRSGPHAAQISGLLTHPTDFALEYIERLVQSEAQLCLDPGRNDLATAR
jgi:hypothetical protein